MPKIEIPEHIMTNGAIQLTITGRQVEVKVLYMGATVFERAFSYGAGPASVA